MYNLVVVSMFKNESMIMKEWLDHNLSIGVQHFYLIDNGSTDNYKTILMPYLKKNLITLVIDPSRWKYGKECKTQVGIYYDNVKMCILEKKGKYNNTQSLLLNKHFLQLIKNNAKWVIAIDQDEYFFSPRGKITDVLHTLPNTCTDLWVPWRIFGSNGHDRQPKSIRKGFIHMRPHEIQQKTINPPQKGKSISRISAITAMEIHQCIIPNRHRITPDGQFCNNLASWIKTYIPNINNDLLFCNHYMVMSREYFIKNKSKRNGGAHENRDMKQYWNDHNKDCYKKDTLLPYLFKL